MLSNEIFANENGLKDRVTACRKRLRLNRIHRARVDNQPEELFQEILMGTSEFRGYSGDRAAAMRESQAEGIHARNGDTAQRVDGQEVGIT
jgi:hypothetical protein